MRPPASLCGSSGGLADAATKPRRTLRIPCIKTIMLPNNRSSTRLFFIPATTMKTILNTLSSLGLLTALAIAPLPSLAKPTAPPLGRIYQQPITENLRALPATGPIDLNAREYQLLTGSPLQLFGPTGQVNTVVKLVDPSRKQPDRHYFVRAGEALNVIVPLGNYKVRYAIGTTWRGNDQLFGEETKYFEIQQPLLFQHKKRQALGHQLVLLPMENGTLSIRAIPRNAF